MEKWKVEERRKSLDIMPVMLSTADTVVDAPAPCWIWHGPSSRQPGAIYRTIHNRKKEKKKKAAPVSRDSITTPGCVCVCVSSLFLSQTIMTSSSLSFSHPSAQRTRGLD